MRGLIWFGAGFVAVVVAAALTEQMARLVGAMHCLVEQPDHRSPDCGPIVEAFCRKDMGAGPLAGALVAGTLLIVRVLVRRHLDG